MIMLGCELHHLLLCPMCLMPSHHNVTFTSPALIFLSHLISPRLVKWNSYITWRIRKRSVLSLRPSCLIHFLSSMSFFLCYVVGFVFLPSGSLESGQSLLSSSDSDSFNLGEMMTKTERASCVHVQMYLSHNVLVLAVRR